MKDFLLVYRADYKTYPNSSPEEMQATTQKWMNWIANVAAQNNLVDRGNSLEKTGKVLKDGGIVDGPYTEIKESIMGYSLIKADSMEQATKIADGCPILKMGGSVEVREIRVL